MAVQSSTVIEPHVCVELAVTPEAQELACALLSLFPISGIEIEGTVLRSYFQAEQWESIGKDFQQLLSQYLPLQLYSVTQVDPQDWYRAWLQQLQPEWIVDAVVVHPYPEPPSLDQYPTARDIIHIVPGTAFGTGHHASTRLAARLLLHHVMPGSTWIDAGTGSGILAILAARHGVGKVYAIDNNPYAVQEAQHNVVRNKVQGCVYVLQGDIEVVELPTVNGIVANLHADLLIRLGKKFAEHL
ncbi:MAG: 50S ribosomal protein L11 methyltransferase, partial [Bacteroidota bacterium]|nr:50S ribosomal protein L11 methyltransferase [Bacteroidota bacterium]